MRLTKARKGDYVIVYFDDHVEDSETGQPMRCVVSGFLQSKGPKFVKVWPWNCLDGSDEVKKVNAKEFILLTSTIRGYILVPMEWIGESPEDSDMG